MWHASSSRAHGFTLLEVLVALAVFAVVGAVSYRGLDFVSANRAHLFGEMRFWREIGQAMDRMEGDLVQIAPQSSVGPDGALLAPVSLSVREGVPVLELVRFDGKRPPARVAYRFRDQGLEFLMWADGSYKVYRLLDHVEHGDFSFVDHQRAWHTSWPSKNNEVRPAGVRVRLSIPGRGDFERIFALP